MSQKTAIEWCDSTLNLQMGCDGCELWTDKERRCYAGISTGRWGGSNKGWPAEFAKPELFLHRLDAAERWPDLTGKDRPNKPWLNGRPRHVFLNDLGDTFTESLPLNWLEPLLPRLEAMPVIVMLLTKRVGRLAEFVRAYGLPANFWLMTSVTSEKSIKRVADLVQIPGDWVRSVSYEPALGPVDFIYPKTIWPDGPPMCCNGEDCGCMGLPVDPPLIQGMERGQKIDQVIVGGESGPGARPFDIQWARDTIRQCGDANVKCFVKQLGSNSVSGKIDTPWEKQTTVQYELKSSKGSNMSEWPEDVRVREMPEARP